MAERRVALVIGNSAYRFAPELPNPRNDAAAVRAALQRLGFEVLAGEDLDGADMSRLLRDFGRQLEGADAGLFFYAGHGLQVGGNNYLVPVDAQLTNELDLEFEATDLNVVLRIMERASVTNLVFLDACRDNPLAENLARSMGATRSTAVGRGLARVESGVGTLITYATQPGNVALDGDGLHSPFTKALVEHIEAPGVDVALMLRRVRQSVLDATGGQQVPWGHSSLTGEFYFMPEVATGAAPVAEAAVAGSPSTDLDALFWASIKDSDNPTMFEQYLAQFPAGIFAGLARARLDELGSQGTETAALTPTPEPIWEAPEIEPVDADYTVVRNANVRAEPNIRAEIVDTLPLGDTVLVAGKVRGANWYLVALPEGREGYVFGRLLVPYEEGAVIAPSPTAQEAEPEPQPTESGETVFNIKPVRYEDERVVGVTEVIQYGLAKALDARVVLDWPFESDETTITGRITMLDASKKEDLEYYGSELAQALLGNLGSSITQSISASTGVYEVKVRLVAENQRTGETTVGKAHVVVLRDGRTDVEQSTNYAINKAFAEATQRLAIRLNGDVPAPLIDATVYDEYKRDRPTQAERPTGPPLDSR